MKDQTQNDEIEKYRKESLNAFVNDKPKSFVFRKIKYFLTHFFKKHSELDLETYNLLESKKTRQSLRRNFL
ncbi:MAG: hypothetical protein SGJ18_02185 [Pseudomonadota bacterium]|nr:hypothetical protein [Pseudomonadota bacterium]